MRSSLQLRLRPLLNRARGRLGWDAAAAIQTRQLAPAETAPAPAYFALEGSLDRVRGTWGQTSLQAELAVFRNPTITHAPVLAHTAREVFIHPAGIEASGGLLAPLAEQLRPKALVQHRLQRVDRVCVASIPYTHKFFGHWVHDGLPTATLHEPDQALYLYAPPAWTHAPQLRALLGLPPSPGPLLYAREAVFFTDLGQGSHKAARYAALRQRVRAAIPAEQAQNQGQRVYLRRSNLAARFPRALADEPALLSRLQAEGFRIVDMHGLTAGQLAARLLGADTVVTLEGSQAAHALLSMKDGGLLVSLTPVDRFASALLPISAACGLRFGLSLIEPSERGYRVDVDALLRTIALAEAGT